MARSRGLLYLPGLLLFFIHILGCEMSLGLRSGERRPAITVASLLPAPPSTNPPLGKQASVRSPAVLGNFLPLLFFLLPQSPTFHLDGARPDALFLSVTSSSRHCPLLRLKWLSGSLLTGPLFFSGPVPRGCYTAR